MRLAVIGSRTFGDFHCLASWMDGLLVRHGQQVVISGGARGADSLAEKWVQEVNESGASIEMIVHLPRWEELGKRAGFVRNQLIVDDCQVLLAFWDTESKGTKHSIDLAIKAKKPVVIVPF